MTPSTEAMRRPERDSRHNRVSTSVSNPHIERIPARNLPLQIEILTKIAHKGTHPEDAELLRAAGYNGPVPGADSANILAKTLMKKLEREQLYATQKRARQAALAARQRQKRVISPQTRALTEAWEELLTSGYVSRTRITQLANLNVEIPHEFLGQTPQPLLPQPLTPPRKNPEASLKNRMDEFLAGLRYPGVSREEVLQRRDNKVWDHIAALTTSAARQGSRFTDSNLREFQHLQAHGIGTGMPPEGRHHDWQFSREFDRHRPLPSPCGNIKLTQFYTAPQGPSDCGTFGFASTAALTTALQHRGIDGINSAIVAYLASDVAAQCQEIIPQASDPLANIEELEAVVHALHAIDFLPIERGYVTIGIENQHGELAPSYAAVWDGGEKPPQIYNPVDFMPQEATGNIDPVRVAQALIERSFRQSSAAGEHPGIVNFIINTGSGHWVAASVIQQPDGDLQMFYFDSQNNLPTEQKMDALRYICRLVLEPPGQEQPQS